MSWSDGPCPDTAMSAAYWPTLRARATRLLLRRHALVDLERQPERAHQRVPPVLVPVNLPRLLQPGRLLQVRRGRGLGSEDVPRVHRAAELVLLLRHVEREQPERVREVNGPLDAKLRFARGLMERRHQLRQRLERRNRGHRGVAP